MKDTVIKFLILVIIAAVLCAGLVFLDNTIANAQDTGTLECIDDCIEECLETEGCVIAIACAAYYAPSTIETGPYPEPPTYDFDWCEWNECAPYPAPLPFSFPTWLQIILDSICLLYTSPSPRDRS